jgi:hypothetical protein
MTEPVMRLQAHTVDLSPPDALAELPSQGGAT